MLLTNKKKKEQEDCEVSDSDSDEEDHDSEALIREKIDNPQMLIYDLECDQSSEGNIHQPNLCIVQKVKVRGNGSFEESRVGDQIIFEGYDCLDQFMNYLQLKENYGSTVIAHNQAGYDGKFILKWLINHSKTPDKYIQQGNRVSYMCLRKNSFRFIDSLNFFLCPLAKLSNMFGIDTVKGYFPHFFKTRENQNYVGPIPDARYYGDMSMMPEAKEAFEK